MPRTFLILLALALAIAPLVNGAPATPPQDDGASGGDASDICSGDLVVLQVDGDTLSGELYPPQDHDDYYALEVDSDDVGDEFTVSFAGHHDMVFDVLMPECGRSVVPRAPNGDATEGAWHVHDDGSGHDHCDIAGHAGDAACDTEQGTQDEFGSITFTPSQEAHYYVHISISPGAEQGGGPSKRWPPGDDVVIIENCHVGCMTYTISSTRSGSTEIS